LTAAEPAFAGTDEVHTVGTQLCDVALHGRGIPHIGIHGRSDEDWAAADEERSAEEIVGESECDSGDGAGGRRGDDGKAGAATESDVFTLIVFAGGKLIVVDRSASECFEGAAADELGCRVCEDDGDASTALHEATAEVCGLISRDTSADAQEHFAVCERICHGTAMGLDGWREGLEVVERGTLFAEVFVDEGRFVFRGAYVFGGVKEDLVLHDFGDDDFHEVLGLDIDELRGAAVELHHAFLDQGRQAEATAYLADNVVFAKVVKHFEPSLRP
jgi:hypothetical protein